MGNYSRVTKKKLPLSASHLILYVVLIVYFAVAAMGAMWTWHCFNNELYEIGAQLAIALFSFTGICGSAAIGFYSNKAKAENTSRAEELKYDKRLQLSLEICKYLDNHEVTVESVNVLKSMISDSDITITAPTDNLAVVEQTKYTVPQILSELENKVESTTDALG